MHSLNPSSPQTGRCIDVRALSADICTSGACRPDHGRLDCTNLLFVRGNILHCPRYPLRHRPGRVQGLCPENPPKGGRDAGVALSLWKPGFAHSEKKFDRNHPHMCDQHPSADLFSPVMFEKHNAKQGCSLVSHRTRPRESRVNFFPHPVKKGFQRDGEAQA